MDDFSVSDRHRGPRQKVIRVAKTGEYGTTIWSHWLDCGHVEKRKRKAPFPHIGCGACVAQERLLINVMRMEETTAPSVSDFAIEDKAKKVAASLARSLSIPVEFVDIKLSDTGFGLRMTGASIWVPKEILETLA